MLLRQLQLVALHTKNLKQQIGHLCESYIKLKPGGELGSLPGMYEPHTEFDETKPSHATSDYLRGETISTMSTFEAFISDLLNEATDLICHETKRCNEECSECEKLNFEHTLDKGNKTLDKVNRRNKVPDLGRITNDIFTRWLQKPEKRKQLKPRSLLLHD